MASQARGRSRRWLVALASALVVSGLLTQRAGCVLQIGGAPSGALDPVHAEDRATGPDVVAAALALVGRREADAPLEAQEIGAVSGGASGVALVAPSTDGATVGPLGRPVTLEVVQARGTPVPHAKVTVERLWFHPSAVPSAFDMLELTADSHGHVRFDSLAELGADLGGALVEQVGLACIATDGGGGASPELLLAPPVEPGPHTLVLGAAADLTIEVVEGAPPLAVAGAEVHLDRAGRESQRPVRATTDTRGLARFRGLSPGSWSTYVQPPGAEHNVRGQLELAPGEDRTLTVTLDEGEEALAVAGRFVDEDGAMIELGSDDHPKLWVGADMTAFGTATAPSADGTFRVYLPRSAEVIVRNFGGHRYEPELARVPFGTQDLVLRRVERFPERTIVVEARDVTTGAALSGAQLTVFDDDARAAAGMSIVERPGPGRLKTTLFERPGTRLAIWSEEYAPRFMSLPPAGATAERPLVVDLERGGPRELYVLDAATLRPIAGVELVGKGGPVAVTDDTGRAETRADHAGWLTLRRASHVPKRFHPTWPWDRVYLARE